MRSFENFSLKAMLVTGLRPNCNICVDSWQQYDHAAEARLLQDNIRRGVSVCRAIFLQFKHSFGVLWPLGEP